MKKKIAVLPGDGVGKEVIRQAVKVCHTLNDLNITELDIVHFYYDARHYLETGIALPDEAVQEIRRKYDGAIVGPIGDPRIKEQLYVKGMLPRLHNELDLCIRYQPVKLLHLELYPFRSGIQENIQFVLFSENIEGFRTDAGNTFKENRPDEIAFHQFVNTRSTIEKVVHHVCEYAREHSLRLFHFADEEEVTQDIHHLWLRILQRNESERKELRIQTTSVKNIVYGLLNNPSKFDLILIPSLYIDAVSTMSAVIQGGVGISAIGDINPGKFGLFRPLHGPVTRFAGKNAANPFGALMAVRLLLEFIGKPKTGQLIEDAIKYCLEHRLTTRDLEGNFGTDEVGDYVCQTIEKLYSQEHPASEHA